MKLLKIFLVLIFILGITYFLGPRPETLNLAGVVPAPLTDLVNLEIQIDKNENADPTIKHDNEAEIIWLDDNKD